MSICCASGTGWELLSGLWFLQCALTREGGIWSWFHRRRNPEVLDPRSAWLQKLCLCSVPVVPGITQAISPSLSQWGLRGSIPLPTCPPSRGPPAPACIPTPSSLSPAAPSNPFSPEASSPLLPMPTEFFHPAVSASQKGQGQDAGAGALPKIALQGSWASLRSPSVNCTLLQQVWRLPG